MKQTEYILTNKPPNIVQTECMCVCVCVCVQYMQYIKGKTESWLIIMVNFLTFLKDLLSLSR